MKTESIILIVVGVLFVLFLLKSASESYGQDASIRAAVGWIAGPKGMYGYDPVDEFAKQIEEMRQEEIRRGDYPPRDTFSKGEIDNLRGRSSHPEMILMTGKPRLVDSPTHDLGPEYYSSESRFRKCNSSRDCWEGEECRVDTCVPASSESYSPGEEKKCKSCMSTEEFERNL
jgi:hypothetical protein